MERAWKPGDAVVLREVWRGRVWTARPVTVVRDADDGQMFYVAPGTRWKCPVGPDGGWLRLPADGWTLGDRVWEDHRVLSFAWPGVAHAVLAYWVASSGRFAGWYINLQEPLLRTAQGFDYMDHTLDIVVAPDRSEWRLKDEDELREAVERGLFSKEEAVAIRAEGERAIRRLVSGAPPFDRPWEDWRPDPAWPVPVLPEGWDSDVPIS